MYCADCWLGSPSLVWSSPHLGPAAASTRPALDTPPDTPAHTSASSSPPSLSSTGTRSHSNQEDAPSVSTLSSSPQPGLNAQWSNLGVHKNITSTVFELQIWFLHQNGVKFCKKCNANDKSIEVCAQCGQTGQMRTKFHVIQAKIIMSVWCFNVQWQH